MHLANGMPYCGVKIVQQEQGWCKGKELREIAAGQKTLELYQTLCQLFWCYVCKLRAAPGFGVV